MRIQIITPGRFHLFDLARELHKSGHLFKLVTTLPKFVAKNFSIPRKKIKSFVWHEVMWRLNNKILDRFGLVYNLQFFFHNLYSRSALKTLNDPVDIVICGSSFALPLIKKAKKLGAIVILERGSTHIGYQTKILQEESKITGYDLVTAHPLVEQRELMEYELADYISIPSSFVESTFISKGIAEDKLIKTPYGVDLSKFRPGKRQDDIFRVIHVGTLNLRKGVHYLLEAFSSLNLENAELLLVGVVTHEIQSYLEKYKSNNIKAIGSVPQDKLLSYYQNSSVFCLSSIEEGMAMVTLQAMACGVPVICTENTGAGDLVTDGIEGFIIPIRNIDALKQKMLFCYDNEIERGIMGKNALKKITQNDYTWSGYGKRITEKYQTLLTHEE
jgi:glycosyltransferase involved in cell wall biosynthesis